MKNEITNKVLTQIESLGEAMSAGAKYGFEIMVQQKFTAGLIDVLTSLPIALLLIFLLWKATVIIKKKWDDIYRNDCEGWVIVGLVIFSLGTIFISVIAYIATVEGLKMMLNPEYYAIKDILDTLK